MSKGMVPSQVGCRISIGTRPRSTRKSRSHDSKTSAAEDSADARWTASAGLSPCCRESDLALSATARVTSWMTRLSCWRKKSVMIWSSSAGMPGERRRLMTSARVQADVITVNLPATMSFRMFWQISARDSSSSASSEIQFVESQYRLPPKSSVVNSPHAPLGGIARPYAPQSLPATDL